MSPATKRYVTEFFTAGGHIVFKESGNKETQIFKINRNEINVKELKVQLSRQ